MNHKEKFDFNVRNNLVKSDSDIETVRVLVNGLLDSLYMPKPDSSMYMIDKERTNYYGVDLNEPVNWGGGLHCSVEKLEEELFRVTIEEASPNDCSTLCDYVALFMGAWGWNVEIKTEW